MPKDHSLPIRNLLQPIAVPLQHNPVSISCGENCVLKFFVQLLTLFSFLFILQDGRSLHRHTFSEIPRLIDISASGNRDMISEKLERDRKHDRPC